MTDTENLAKLFDEVAEEQARFAREAASSEAKE